MQLVHVHVDLHVDLVGPSARKELDHLAYDRTLQ